MRAPTRLLAAAALVLGGATASASAGSYSFSFSYGSHIDTAWCEPDWFLSVDYAPCPPAPVIVAPVVYEPVFCDPIWYEYDYYCAPVIVRPVYAYRPVYCYSPVYWRPSWTFGWSYTSYNYSYASFSYWGSSRWCAPVVYHHQRRYDYCSPHYRDYCDNNRDYSRRHYERRNEVDAYYIGSDHDRRTVASRGDSRSGGRTALVSSDRGPVPNRALDGGNGRVIARPSNDRPLPNRVGSDGRGDLARPVVERPSDRGDIVDGKGRPSVDRPTIDRPSNRPSGDVASGRPDLPARPSADAGSGSGKGRPSVDRPGTDRPVIERPGNRGGDDRPAVDIPNDRPSVDRPSGDSGRGGRPVIERPTNRPPANEGSKGDVKRPPTRDRATIERAAEDSPISFGNRDSDGSYRGSRGPQIDWNRTIDSTPGTMGRENFGTDSSRTIRDSRPATSLDRSTRTITPAPSMRGSTGSVPSSMPLGRTSRPAPSRGSTSNLYSSPNMPSAGGLPDYSTMRGDSATGATRGSTSSSRSSGRTASRGSSSR